MSGLPDATIRKIFSGETSDPRFETVAKLVTAMGGSMNEIVERNNGEEIEMNSIIAIKEIYEARINDLKASASELANSLHKDKRYLAAATCVLGAVLIGFLIFDLLMSNVGWIRY